MKHETISNITTDLTARDPATGVALNKSKGGWTFYSKKQFYIALYIRSYLYLCLRGRVLRNFCYATLNSCRQYYAYY